MALPTDCLKFFAQFIENETGIVYSEVNFYQLEGRLEDISKQLGVNGPIDLWERAKTQGLTGSMKLLLTDIATNNETSFFRDPRVFKAVERIITEDLSHLGAGQAYRIWSAACSTGQEVYSLAMILADMNLKTPFNYQITATDISERVLKRAEEGYYSQLEVQRGLTMPQLIRFFSQEKASADSIKAWVVNQELKRNLSFRKLNLLENWRGLDVYHLILCRNVLIYQTVENKRKVITKLFDQLAPGGYLILGGAESLIGIFDALDYTSVEDVVVYRRPLGNPRQAAN